MRHQISRFPCRIRQRDHCFLSIPEHNPANSKQLHRAGLDELQRASGMVHALTLKVRDMQVIITSAGIAGGSFRAVTQNHAALSRATLGFFVHVLRAVGFI